MLFNTHFREVLHSSLCLPRMGPPRQAHRDRIRRQRQETRKTLNSRLEDIRIELDIHFATSSITPASVADLLKEDQAICTSLGGGKEPYKIPPCYPTSLVAVAAAAGPAIPPGDVSVFYNPDMIVLI